MNKINEPSFHPNRPFHGCGNVEILEHWTQMAQCSDGSYVHAVAKTEREVRVELKRLIEERENLISKSPKEQLRLYLNKYSGERFNLGDHDEILKLLIKAVIE